jgi:hypothetical protein
MVGDVLASYSGYIKDEGIRGEVSGWGEGDSSIEE